MSIQNRADAEVNRGYIELIPMHQQTSENIGNHRESSG